jgi:glycosyltransferase involved in cell wall biosynthesis
MFPKVSILIPTYNRPFFFHQALKSALNQTYPNIEIVVCDNSENELSENIVKRYKGKEHPINYFRNSRNIGPVLNQQKCFYLSTGEYINYLMDDDLFHPGKIEKMMHYFQNYSEVTLVTSCIQPIDERGTYIEIDEFPFKKLYPKDAIINGFTLGNSILRDKTNYIGAPTMVLFRKSDLEEPFGIFSGKRAQNNVDVATWLNLLTKGNAVYIAEPLSYFRVHSSQLTQLGSWDAISKGTQDWTNHVNDAKNKGFLKNLGWGKG